MNAKDKISYPNDPQPGALCWCCGEEAEYFALSNELNWCFPCKFGEPCSGHCGQ